MKHSNAKKPYKSGKNNHIIIKNKTNKKKKRKNENENEN